MSNKQPFDIETTSTESEHALEIIRSEIEAKAKDIKAPKNYGEVKATEYVERETQKLHDSFDTQVAKTALNPNYGHLIAIGCGEFVEVIKDVTDEKDLLSEFFAYLRGCDTLPLLYGHNIKGFDFPFIYKRAVILGANPKFNFKDAYMHRYSKIVFDSMQEWCGYKEYISADNLAKLLGVKGKGDIDGSMVPAMFKAGRHEEIKEYIADDLRINREIYEKMTFGG